MEAINHIGHRFERLLVLERAHREHSKKVFWKCKCDCNKIVIADGWSLRRSKTTSCGCKRREEFVKRNTSHSMSHTKVYSIWRQMIQRCENSKAFKYDCYGGRGIKVCKEWHMFENFLSDMGEPLNEYTLERIDNFKNYDPKNCKWATRLEQSKNTRHNRNLTFRGETHCVTEWARKLKIKPATIFTRLHRGWKTEEALTSA